MLEESTQKAIEALLIKQESRLLYFRRRRLDLPDAFAVIADGPVGGELAHARHVEDGHAIPMLRIAPRAPDLGLAVDVGLIVR